MAKPPAPNAKTEYQVTKPPYLDEKYTPEQQIELVRCTVEDRKSVV